LRGQILWDLLAQRCATWAEPLAVLRDDPEAFSATRLRLAMGPGPQAVWFRLESARHETGSFVRFQSILPPLSDLEESSWDDYLRTESARREMFVRLLRAESQLKNLTDRWPGVIFSQRADFSFRFVSPQIERLTGVGIHHWQTKPQLFWQVVHEGDADDLRAKLRTAKETRQPLSVTYRVRHLETGRVSYILEHRQTHVSGGGLLLGYEGVWLDVTRQTIAEKSLVAASLKDTLSVLTMGLAHDFGNVMAGIHALSESFLEQNSVANEFTEGLTLIKRNAQQASQLVHRIIDLHQGCTGESHYHNLNELITGIADLVRKIVPRRMECILDLCAEALPVYLDAVELRQVVIHLVLNAREAMPEDGRLVLRSSACAPLPALPGLQGARPRTPAACLSVQDSGGGIKAAHLPNIFDPFFTTKPANKGTGLGLHNARQFVERHHGGISVDTQEGAGTTVTLWLPQADFTETASGGHRPPAVKPSRDI
jgi:signal transduction histidine kinase